MSESLTINSHGPRIVATNFWESDFDRDGLFYLSVQAGVIRLLVPRGREGLVAEMATGRRVILSTPRRMWVYAAEVWFDDRTDSPFVLHLDPAQADPLPPPELDRRTDLACTVWTQPQAGVPVQALRRPASFRIVPRVPWLKFWETE